MRLVGPSQNAFIIGRIITDSCLLAHEALSVVKTKTRGRLYATLKLDMNKAYDRVRWDFIEAILTKPGFPSHWIKLIMNCITTVRYSVLINGIPTPHITSKAGLRQGDPYRHTYSSCAWKSSLKCWDTARQTAQIKGNKMARYSQ